jgi:hypothetical protein
MQSTIFDRRIFTEQHALLLSSVSTLTPQAKFVIDNAPDILLRMNVVSLSDNTDSFVFETSSSPNDEIIYTSKTDLVDLNRRDGGFF